MIIVRVKSVGPTKATFFSVVTSTTDVNGFQGYIASSVKG